MLRLSSGLDGASKIMLARAEVEDGDELTNSTTPSGQHVGPSGVGAKDAKI